MDALKLAGVRNLPAFTRGEMKLPIAKYGDPILRAKGRPIAKIDDELRALASDMLETMHAANGVGLAAQQIGQGAAANRAGYFAGGGSPEHVEIERERSRSHRINAAGPDQSAARSR